MIENELSHSDAENEATLLRYTVDSKNSSTELLKYLDKMSQTDEKLLKRIIVTPEAEVPLENKSTFPLMKKVAEVVLKIKKDPSLLLEMVKDPSHPRLLDMQNVNLDILKAMNSELYSAHFDRANLAAELETELGEEELKTLIDEVNQTANSLKKNDIRFPEIMQGVSISLLAVIIVQKKPQFSDNPKLSPFVWGKLYSLVGTNLKLDELISKDKTV